jgi:hypothetical protein
MTIEKVTKWRSGQEVWWEIKVFGGMVDLSTEERKSYRRFSIQCMDKLNRVPPYMPKAEWKAHISRLMATAEAAEF